VQESRCLYVYADRKRRSKWIARFDMNPEHRQGFVDLRRWAAKKYPQTAEGQKLGQNSGDAWLAPKAQRFGESTGDARTSKFGRIDMESAEEESRNNSADAR
jgi:hypothetical protein